MKINITNKQYPKLMQAVVIASAVLGSLKDETGDEDHESQAKEIDEIQDYLVQFAKDFGAEDMLDDSGHIDDDFYDKKIMSLISEYDKAMSFSTLSNVLAWRDFKKDKTEEEIKKMSEENNNYFGTEIYDYEKKYWDEFEKHGLQRLVINSLIK